MCQENDYIGVMRGGQPPHTSRQPGVCARTLEARHVTSVVQTMHAHGKAQMVSQLCFGTALVKTCRCLFSRHFSYVMRTWSS